MLSENWRIRVQVIPPGYKEVITAEYCVSPHCANDFHWRPYDECADPFDAFLFGGKTKIDAQISDKERERLAKIIAQSVTKTIMDTLKKRDTINGYQKEN